ncbi:hypothetical protein [Actinokineospora enzanensis]|uniref:hypothetical protein n=1 Tax=Actinokineospora enzanensis TaxID=155975 RepID=UPI0003705289|nr:hypothetical protein [Actinokineospora enzanensis]
MRSVALFLVALLAAAGLATTPCAAGVGHRCTPAEQIRTDADPVSRGAAVSISIPVNGQVAALLGTESVLRATWYAVVDSGATPIPAESGGAVLAARGPPVGR